jgi:hypothetical protein
MNPTQRKLHEIEAETRYFTLDRLLLVPIVVAFAVLAIVPVALAVAPVLADLSQALRHAAPPH